MLTDFAGSHADYRAWLATITGTHRRRITVVVTDLEHKPLSELTDKFIGGNITVDTTRSPSRIATIELLDPSRSLQFEPDSPATLPLHLTRMLRIGWSVYVPSLERWVTCPVITGRIKDFDREGVKVTITIEGKEVLALGQAGRSATYPKKTKKVDAIRRILSAAGETRFDFPSTTGSDGVGASLPQAVIVRTMDSWWPHAAKIARSMDRLLFYDARGVAVLRRPPSRPIFTFDRMTLASEVRFDRDPSGIRNRWLVFGGKPKGAKQRVHADVRLQPSSALSPAKLGPNDAEFFQIDRVENGNIKTKAEALKVARRRRDDALRSTTNYAFDALPIPHLEEGDLVRVRTDDGAFIVRMRQWTLPLGIDGAPAMSVGSLKRTTIPTGRLGGGRRGGRGAGTGQSLDTGGRST